MNKDNSYTLPSGRRVTVIDVRDGKVVHGIEGVRSLLPLSVSVEEFHRMIRPSEPTAI